MNNAISKISSFYLKSIILFGVSFFIFFSTAVLAEAATLSFSPNTGVYAANGTFSVNVLVNTSGQSINAAEGSLSFNPRELSVVSVNRSSSIFNLWVTEPTYSNAAGTINFSGGSPSGFSGSAGNIMSVTFRAAGAGTARVSFKNGSVLANDGKGTNVLTSMNGGTYTIQAASAAPEPEIIEYIAPANTPAAPSVESTTHGDPRKWHKNKEAVLSWSLPAGVTSVRTLLDSNPATVPTKVYDSPIKNITLSDLSEGESYFHIQFKNSDGWGKVTHYRLAVDSENPSKIDIKQADSSDSANPNQVLSVEVVDKTSLVRKFKVKVDNAEPFDYIDETGSSTITLPALEPGYHSVIIEAFDEAGNSIVGTFSLTIEAFSKPVFTDYPNEINEEVIPVIKGLTRGNATVDIILKRVGGEPTVYAVIANEAGEFIFIPEGTFSTGVYELSAQATDEFGAQSDVSNVIRIAVQQPGYLKIGTMIVSVLSVIIPLIVLVFVMIFGTWYMLAYVKRFRRKVGVESAEALEILHREFSSLQVILREQESIVQASRKTRKLTKSESDMIEVLDKALQASQQAVEKEIIDVTKLTKKKVK